MRKDAFRQVLIIECRILPSWTTHIQSYHDMPHSRSDSMGKPQGVISYGHTQLNLKKPLSAGKIKQLDFDYKAADQLSSLM